MKGLLYTVYIWVFSADILHTSLIKSTCTQHNGHNYGVHWCGSISHWWTISATLWLFMTLTQSYPYKMMIGHQWNYGSTTDRTGYPLLLIHRIKASSMCNGPFVLLFRASVILPPCLCSDLTFAFSHSFIYLFISIYLYRIPNSARLFFN